MRVLEKSYAKHSFSFPLSGHKTPFITKTLLKHTISFTILFGLTYILTVKGPGLKTLLSPLFLLSLSLEFLILLLISLRISFLFRSAGEGLSLKTIYTINLTNRFYTIFLPSLLSEATRALKYHLYGIKDGRSILFLIVGDRIIGYITFSAIFLMSILYSALSKGEYQKQLPILAGILLFVILTIFLLKRTIKRKVPNHIQSKHLLISCLLSVAAQTVILLKYFFIIRLMLMINLTFSQVALFGSASHLSQILPLSLGFFGTKEAFMFFTLNATSGDITKATSFICIVGFIEVLTGSLGGILHLFQWKANKESR
ncbi:MAG: lysylphosphatidylglycerol synthase domain-containing protein [Desulfobacterota bacterium]|nr:lysylphosphatidylglycerol synthase domain-containing protein [Thermodesulfobacteriota bacterium]